MNEEKNKNEKVKKVIKRRKLKLGYILSLVAIIIVAVLILKLVLPSGSSKYGDRLEGIEKIKFVTKEQNKIVEKIKSNDKVTSAKIHVEGKIVNIIYNVSKETSKDDAKAIGNDSLSSISDEVKNFYDIQFMVSKKDEEGTKTTKKKEDGTEYEVVVTEFPIMGYKKKDSSRIVW